MLRWQIYQRGAREGGGKTRTHTRDTKVKFIFYLWVAPYKYTVFQQPFIQYPSPPSPHKTVAATIHTVGVGLPLCNADILFQNGQALLKHQNAEFSIKYTFFHVQCQFIYLNPPSWKMPYTACIDILFTYPSGVSGAITNTSSYNYLGSVLDYSRYLWTHGAGQIRSQNPEYTAAHSYNTHYTHNSNEGQSVFKASF